MPTITDHAIATPNKPAFIMGSTGEAVTFDELDTIANQVAQLLRASGVQRGHRHDDEKLRVYGDHVRLYASWVVFTPISTHLKKDETAYIINNCRAKLFIVSGSLNVPQKLQRKRRTGHCFIVGGERSGFVDWHLTLAEQRSEPIADQSLGVPMLYSSGTTGKPKGVFRAPENIVRNTR